tara:strand:+ start:297 stop:512 length:216 start_codon:yes stop_codon:yes gene_type:complete
MRCSNPVTYFVPRGYSHVEISISCGSTDHRGDRAICETCESSPAIMKGIRAHEDAINADNDWLRSAGWGEI